MVNPVSNTPVSPAAHDLPDTAQAGTSEPPQQETPSSSSEAARARLSSLGNAKSKKLRDQASESNTASQQPEASERPPAERTEATAGTQNSESTAAPDAATPNGPTVPHRAANPDVHGTHPGSHGESGDMMDQQKLMMKQQNEAMLGQIQMQTEMSQQQNVFQLITGNTKATETAFASVMSSLVDSAKSGAELAKKGGEATSAAI